jgi:phenylpropionate dioxygenase-like ring-hydroxylating dioxygenase large terminal subunit
MMNRDDNLVACRVGPGTPMGSVLRSYWMPALLAADLPKPDCAPVRVRLLGEDLVAFRDSDGRVGFLDEFCPHRGASLFLGRNEDRGLRCVYHGWKFDVDGTCVDMPNEPSETQFKERIHHVAYPTRETGDVIWAYMGPRDKPPALPDFEWMRVPSSHRFVSKTLQYSNYLQGVEGGIDTVHTQFLHNNNLGDSSTLTRAAAPRLEVERTDYGFRYAGLRDLGAEGTYARVYQFVMPFHQFRPDAPLRRGAGPSPTPITRGHMWVPIDDENTWVFNWMLASDEDRPLTRELIEEHEASAGRGPDGEVGAQRRRTRANDWNIDREIQRTRTFTGIEGINNQDLAVQESMGAIANRAREHLGQTDMAVIAARRLMLDAVKSVAEGIDPPGVDPATYRRVRARQFIVPKDVRWQDAAERERTLSS